MSVTRLLLPFCFLCCCFQIQAQTEKAEIRSTLMNYLDGTSFNQSQRIKKAFYEDAKLFLSKKGHDIWLVPIDTYAGWFDKNQGKFNGRKGRIISIDIENDIALAKAEILIPRRKMYFIDIFILKKIAGNWKIISKAATRKDWALHPKLNQIKPVKDTIMDGLLHPWSMAFLNEQEALLAEKDGNLLKINLVTKEKIIIQDFPSDLVDSIRATTRGDNSGIFEVLLHPNFDDNRWVYVSYAAKKKGKTTTKVIRAKLENNALIEVQTILEAAPYTRAYFHYGGGMTFGLDGKLYITIGERLFKEIDEPALPIAQDVQDKRGKIYRLNEDGSIPDDNPDFGEEAVPGLYALGIRAAQGITRNPLTGDIWFSEHGTHQGDEINLLKAGANYGWPIKTTGKYRSADYKAPVMEGVDFAPPQWYWQHTVAPTGLTFYTGEEFPQWKNSLIVPGLSKGSLWRFSIEGRTIKGTEELFIDDRVRSRKVIQSPDGKLFMLTDEKNGKVIRIRNDN